MGLDTRTGSVNPAFVARRLEQQHAEGGWGGGAEDVGYCGGNTVLSAPIHFYTPLPPQPYKPNQRGNTATNGGLIDRWGHADQRRESLLQSAPCVCVCESVCLMESEVEKTRPSAEGEELRRVSPAAHQRFPANPVDLFRMYTLGRNPWEMLGKGINKQIRNLEFGGT